MTVDYDLIIVGGAPVGRDAALRASQTGARVALVTASNPDGLEQWLLSDLLAQLNRRVGQQDWLQTWLPAWNPAQPRLAWPQLTTWVSALAETLEISTALTTSLTHLMAAGVDVIQAPAEFCQRPRLGLVAERLLRARAYLLTPLPQATVPPIPGLVQFATCADWPQRWPAQPANLVILGTEPDGLLLAQVLNRLGTQVTILTQRDRLLPDLELSWALQLQLEAEGVTVLTRTEVRQIQPLGNHSQLRLVNLSEHLDPTELVLETAAILLASTSIFDLTALHLERVGVVWHSHQIPLNRRLQTSQPRIYACAATPEQLSARSTLCYEVEIALHNALFWPPQSVTLTHLPQVLPTDPEIAWVGLTEAEARRRYGSEVRVARQLEKSRLSAQVGNRSSGFVKLIAHRNGRLLGGQAVGEARLELAPLAMALQQNLKLKDLAPLLRATADSSELLLRAVQELQQQSPRWQRELLEAWFDFRRSR
jgi:pyruvate/2-oxoglutarate dehydrogenase complex dihydrolipoamide dehydrogenase (E3) component